MQFKHIYWCNCCMYHFFLKWGILLQVNSVNKVSCGGYLKLTFIVFRYSPASYNPCNTTRVSQRFCNILVYVSLWHLIYMTEAVQIVEGIQCSQKYCGSWYVDMLSITSVHVWFKSFEDDHVTQGSYVLQIWTGP